MKKKTTSRKILEVQITSPLKDAVRITSHPELCEKRLRKGCTSLMYACQQGLTDRVIEKVHTEVKIKRFDSCLMSRSQFCCTKVSTEIHSFARCIITSPFLSFLPFSFNLLINFFISRLLLLPPLWPHVMTSFLH
jgi:hypothetical protein